jgi:hypothetical protein
MSNDEAGLSPSAKKAARDAARRASRTRKRAVESALRADWEGRDPDTYNILDAALTADGETRMTSWILFGLASRTISELSDATGASHEELLTRLLR